MAPICGANPAPVMTRLPHSAASRLPCCPGSMRDDAAGVTENGEALGSADRPQALSKKTARGDRAVVCQLGLNPGGQWPLHSPRAAVASSRFRFGAANGCSGSVPVISTSSLCSEV